METPPTGPIAPVPIMLDQERHLLLDGWALWQCEQQMRKMYGPQANVLTLLQPQSVGITETIVMLWAALRHEAPDLSLEQAGHLVHFGNFLQVRQALEQCIANQVPMTEGEGNGADPLAPEALTGPASGPEPSMTSDSPPSSSGA